MALTSEQILEWFKQLPDGYREEAIRLHKEYPEPLTELKDIYPDSLSGALLCGFRWQDTIYHWGYVIKAAQEQEKAEIFSGKYTW